MIKVGIAGCGSIVKFRHAPEYLANKDAEIKGFYDYFPERATAMADEFGGKVYESFEDMLSDDEIDAVSICTANEFHSSMTIQALKSGKHVLCEKPMAMTVEEAAAMVDTAEETGRTLMIGHNQRLVPAHKLAKQLIEDNVIGKVLSFQATFSHPGPEAWGVDKSKGTWFFKKDLAGFGSLADLGVHKIDLIRWLIGAEMSEVTSLIATLDKTNEEGKLIEVDDNSISIIKMENGVIGSVTTGWTNYGEEDNSTIIYGTKGVIEIFRDPRYSVKVLLKNGQKINYEVGSIQTNTNQTNSGVIDLFVENLLNNTKPEISGQDAMKVMKIVIAMDESSKTKRTVKINQH